MRSQTLTYLLAAAFIAMALLFFNQSLHLFSPSNTAEKYLSPYEVRGIAVISQEKPYTLNFEQQNQVMEILNRAIPVGHVGNAERKKPPFEKVVIYRFDKPEVELVPEAMNEDSIVFKVKEWNPEGYVSELSDGDLLHLLTEASTP